MESVAAIVAQLRSLDLETHLFQPGLAAPPMIVGSTAKVARGTEQLLAPAQVRTALRALAHGNEIVTGANIAFDFGVLAVDDPTTLPLIFKLYDERRVYDVQIAQALDAIAGGHLFRTKDGQPLLSPSTGKQSNRYSLDLCTFLELGRSDAKKNDYWRLRYALLERVPPREWPREAWQYPLDDARNTVEVAAAQLSRGARNVGDLPAQVETAFDLHLGGAIWGLRTDRVRTEALAARTEKAHLEVVKKYGAAGFLRADGKEDQPAVKRAVAKAYGASGVCPTCRGWGRVQSPKGGGATVICAAKLGGCDGTGLDLSTAPSLTRTDKGAISTSRDTLIESGDELLAEYAENQEEKIRNTYIPFLRQGYDRPINLSPNVLVASGRTSYDGVIQLFPRKGGVRDCVRARDGYYFLSVDYSAIELVTLAQCCYWLFGWSNMRDIINSTQDPGALHTALGGRLIGKSLEEMKALIKAGDQRAKDARQGAKPWNFGAPGMMSAAKLVLNQRGGDKGSTTAPNGKVYTGIRFCILLGDAQECGTGKITEWKKRVIPPVCKACVEICEHVIKPAWFAEFPEIREYFSWVTWMVDTNGEIPAFGPVERVRGGLGGPDGANTGFQSLNADGGKYAYRCVTRACYTNPNSALWGTRPLLFAHDEIFAETPRWKAHDAAMEMVRMMVESMRVYTPDVFVRAEPALMTHWLKDAEPVYFDSRVGAKCKCSGDVHTPHCRLVPWQPKEKAA